MQIRPATKADHPRLLELWEASVRASHDFLAEEDLQQLKPLILEQYFDAVNLSCVVNPAGDILGFCGVLQGNIEMLFIDPAMRGQGIGAMLVAAVISQQGASKVDVNEQNSQALGFYQHLGFVVTGRSALDGQGKPYPLLHLALPQAGMQLQ